MAIKKRKKRLHQSSSGHHRETSRSKDPDKTASNSENDCTCLDSILAVGFDPYVTARLFDTMKTKYQQFATLPVYNAKRSVTWSEQERNEMRWKIPEDQLPQSIISLSLFDEEVGIDPQIGTVLINVDEHIDVGKINEEVQFEQSIRRRISKETKQQRGDIENLKKNITMHYEGICNQKVTIENQENEIHEKNTTIQKHQKIIDLCQELRKKQNEIDGVFTGVLTLKLKLEKTKEKSKEIKTIYEIILTVVQADHLKKERETDATSDQSTMFWIIVAFAIYLTGIAAIFYWIENPEKQNLAEDDNTTDDYDEYELDKAVRVGSWWDGFWFAFITATTVGYGDKRPETAPGRFLNSFVICFDVLFIGFALGLIVDFIAKSAERANARSKMKRNEISEQSRVDKFRDIVDMIYILKEKNSIKREDTEIIGGEPTDLQNKTENDCSDVLTKPEEKIDLSEEFDEDEFMRKKEKDYQKRFMWELFTHVVLVFILIVVGSVIFWQEEGWTYAESLHFCFVTMSTVGYGDIVPGKPGTKVFCMFYIVFGVGLLVRLGDMCCRKIIEKQQKKIQQKRADESLMHWEQIAEFDVEGDGELDMYEFARAILRATGKVSEEDLDQINNLFNKIDTDKSGYITKEDFEAAAEEKKAKEIREKQKKKSKK